MLSNVLSEPRGGSGLKYHSDVVPLVLVKGLVRLLRPIAHRALLASALQAASSQRFCGVD